MTLKEAIANRNKGETAQQELLRAAKDCIRVAAYQTTATKALRRAVERMEGK